MLALYAIAEDQSTVEIASSEAPVLTSCQPNQAGIALQRPGKAAIQYDESANCERKLVEPFFGRLEDGPAVPDRWRIVQTLGYKEQILNPYAAHKPLKGDLPVFGKDWFSPSQASQIVSLNPGDFRCRLALPPLTERDGTI